MTDHRLAKIFRLIEDIDDDCSTAIQCLEISRKITYDAQYLKRFSSSYSAHVIEYLQYAMLRDGISIFCRMWDTDKDSHSLPNLLIELERDEITSLLKENVQSFVLQKGERPAYINLVDKYGESYAQDFRASLKKKADEAVSHFMKTFGELINRPKESNFIELKDQLFNWRNQRISHRTEKTRADRKREKSGVPPIEPLKWGKMDEALKFTIKFYEDIRIQVDGMNISSQDTHRVWSVYAESFWNSISESPR